MAHLNPAEVERLIAYAPPEHQCTVRFLFMTGVRIGELRGLQWPDVDWASNRLIVHRQLSEVTGELASPKTDAGQRWIDLPVS
ncbi:MAG: tyrosine-type recombinase/integrase [Steroidobacteraceae bacterium]